MRKLTFHENKTSPRVIKIQSAISPFEAQNLKAEINKKAYGILEKQTRELKQLEFKLESFKHETNTKELTFERKNNTWNKQADENKQIINKFEMEEIIPLNHYVSKLNQTYETYLFNDFSDKMRPIQNDLETLQLKINNLTKEHSTNIAEIHQNLQKISVGINSNNAGIQNISVNQTEKLLILIPKLYKLDQQLNEIKLNFIEAIKTKYDVDNQINDINSHLTKIKNKGFSKQIEEINSSFDKSIKEINSMFDENLSTFQNELEEAINNHNLSNNNNITINKCIENLMNKHKENQNEITQIQNNLYNKINDYEETINLKLDSYAKKMNGFKNRKASNLNSQENPDFLLFQSYAQSLISKINDTVDKSTKENEKAQKEANSQLSSIQDQIENEGNVFERINRLEDQLKWCINNINEVNYQQKTRFSNGNDLLLLQRITNLEKRLTSAENFLKGVDNLEANPQTKLENYQIEIKERNARRELPHIPEETFHEIQEMCSMESIQILKNRILNDDNISS